MGENIWALSERTVVKGIRRVWQAHFMTVFPFEHPRRTKASAQTYFSRDEFGRSFSLSVYILPLQEMSAIPSVRQTVFGFIHRLVSLQYSTIYPTSKIAIVMQLRVSPLVFSQKTHACLYKYYTLLLSVLFGESFDVILR